MRYILIILFGLLALAAVSIVVFIAPPQVSAVGMQIRQTVAIVGLAIVVMSFVAITCIEKIWTLLKK